MTRQVFVWGDAGFPLLGATLGDGFAGEVPTASGSLGELRVGDEVALSRNESHHASVKRLRVGELVDLVDGRGGRAGAEVVSVGAQLRLRLRELPRVEPMSVLRLTLIQALAKEKRDLQAVEAACEIGVTRVVPWGAARCVSRWDSASKREKGGEKWRNLVLSALKQSRQSWLATVGEYVESGESADFLDGKPGVASPPGLIPRATSGENSVFAEVERIVAGGGRVFVLHESAVERLSALLRAEIREAPREAGKNPTGGVKNPRVADSDTPEKYIMEGCGVVRAQREIAVVVGPEGGITEAELAGFSAAGAKIVLLGSSVLRCSTAGPVALAIIQATLGSW